MVSYLYRIPTGLAGDITRTNGSTIEPATISPSSFSAGVETPTAYGVPVVVSTTGGNLNNMRVVKAADTRIFGILVREYPTAAAQDPLGVATPYAAIGASCSVMRRGYMTVLLSGSTAAVKGAPVYIWTATATGSHIVGGFESTDPTTSGFVLPNTYFEGPADALGIVEIAYNV